MVYSPELVRMLPGYRGNRKQLKSAGKMPVYALEIPLLLA